MSSPIATFVDFNTFAITQLALGSPLTFDPAVGTPQLDNLINDYIPGNMSVQQKRAQVTIDFLNSVDAELLYGPVTRVYYVLPNLSLDTQSASPSATSSNRSSRHHLVGASSASSLSGKRSRDESTSPSSASSAKRMPGFSIMTRDGLDITEYASRGPKTKEQRDHAALMRKLKACNKCKKSKQRCDPSHHPSVQSPGSSSSEGTPSSVSGPKSFVSSPGSRISVSPQSAVENSFRRSPTQSGQALAQVGQMFPSFDTSDSFWAGAMPEPDISQGDEAVSPLEQRRQALLQQQAEIDVELAALDVNHHGSMARQSGPFGGNVFISQSLDDIYDSSLRIHQQPQIPSSLDGLAQYRQAHTAVGDDKFETQSLDRILFGEGAGDSSQGTRKSTIICSGDMPFDHNYRIKSGYQEDFVLFPEGSSSRHAHNPALRRESLAIISGFPPPTSAEGGSASPVLEMSTMRANPPPFDRLRHHQSLESDPRPSASAEDLIPRRQISSNAQALESSVASQQQIARAAESAGGAHASSGGERVFEISNKLHSEAVDSSVIPGGVTSNVPRQFVSQRVESSDTVNLVKSEIQHKQDCRVDQNQQLPMYTGKQLQSGARRQPVDIAFDDHIPANTSRTLTQRVPKGAEEGACRVDLRKKTSHKRDVHNHVRNISVGPQLDPRPPRCEDLGYPGTSSESTIVLRANNSSGCDGLVAIRDDIRTSGFTPFVVSSIDSDSLFARHLSSRILRQIVEKFCLKVEYLLLVFCIFSVPATSICAWPLVLVLLGILAFSEQSLSDSSAKSSGRNILSRFYGTGKSGQKIRSRGSWGRSLGLFSPVAGFV